MTEPWQQIDSTATARRISEGVCWDDSSLVDAIFCRTVLLTKNGSSTTGHGLRVLISCCSAPRSHLELCFLEITEQVAMPIDLGYFNGFFAENGQFRFGFHYNNFQHQCRRPYFRFCDLNYLEVSGLYSSPAVLEPSEGQLSSEGFVECRHP